MSSLEEPSLERFFDNNDSNLNPEDVEALGIPEKPTRLRKMGEVLTGTVVAVTLMGLGALGQYILDTHDVRSNDTGDVVDDIHGIEGNTTGEIVTNVGNLAADLCGLKALEEVVPETGVNTSSPEKDKQSAQDEVNNNYGRCLEEQFTIPVGKFLETAGWPVLETYLDYIERNS